MGLLCKIQVKSTVHYVYYAAYILYCAYIRKALTIIIRSYNGALRAPNQETDYNNYSILSFVYEANKY